MDTTTKQRYVFHHLTLIDMGRASMSLKYMSETRDAHIRGALFRDAVISYAKPFSSNKDLSGKPGLRMTDSFIPAPLNTAHREVLNLRNKLFAHLDLDHQAPQVSVYQIDGYSRVTFSVTGYQRVFAEHLVEPLATLVQKAHTHCLSELKIIGSTV